MTYVYIFLFYGFDYGLQPKFLMAKHSDTAEGENWAYGPTLRTRECIRNVDLRVQVHPGEIRSENQQVHIVLEALNSAGAKGDVLKICGFVQPLHPL